MSDMECPRCGAAMQAGGVCPVCEIPHDATGATTAPEDDAPATLAGRLWQSGQLAVAVTIALFALALFVPLARDVRLPTGLVDVRPWDLLMGTFPAIRGRPTDWVLPGAAVFLASLLYSRRAGATMMASRPVVLVVSVLPVFSVVMPFLFFKKRGLAPGVGPAAVVVALGMVLGVVGALRFGRGVADKRRAPRHDDEE